MGFPLGAVLGIGSSLLGFLGSRDRSSSQARASEQMAALAREILNASKPNVSEDQLYQLLLAADQQGTDRAMDRNIATLKRISARTGFPNGQVINDAMSHWGDFMGDKTATARLNAIRGVMPSPQGLQLYNNLMQGAIGLNANRSPLASDAATGLGYLTGFLEPRDPAGQEEFWGLGKNQRRPLTNG